MKSKHSFKSPPNRKNAKNELIENIGQGLSNKLRERYRPKGNLLSTKAESYEQKKRSLI